LSSMEVRILIADERDRFSENSRIGLRKMDHWID